MLDQLSSALLTMSLLGTLISVIDFWLLIDD
jgi:hypothetical protein